MIRPASHTLSVLALAACMGSACGGKARSDPDASGTDETSESTGDDGDSSASNSTESESTESESETTESESESTESESESTESESSESESESTESESESTESESESTESESESTESDSESTGTEGGDGDGGSVGDGDSGGDGDGDGDGDGEPDCTVPEIESPERVLVYLIAGQSNAEGHAIVWQSDVDSGNPLGVALESVADDQQYPRCYLYPRDDVELTYYDAEDFELFFEAEALQPEMGDQDSGLIRSGVEIGLGHRLADAIDDPLMLLKVAHGASSLGVDWRPPSAVLQRGGEVGPLYANLVVAANDFLSQPPSHYPEAQYELGGVIWIQGWTDGYPTPSNEDYALDLRDLATDLRTDLNHAELPFVVVEAPDPYSVLFQPRIQAVALLEQELPGRNRFVETHSDLLDNDWFVVNEPYQWHYHQSARNYLEVGHATADAILDAAFVGTSAP